MGRDKDCKDTVQGRLTGGIIVTGIGLVFLLANFNVIPPIGDSWPLFLVVVGGALLFGAMRDRRKREKGVPPDNFAPDDLPPS